MLDDVTPLRQLDSLAADAPAWLFAPAPAVRLRPAGFTGTPLPKDEPKAENPPSGAMVDYFLRQASEEPVTLEVLDAGGALVRRYSSADEVPTADPAKLRTAPQWFEPPSALSSAPGMHRFVWPLHHSAPPELAAGNTWEDGPWVVPGRYRLVLTVDGKRFEQPLEVTPDPRVGLSAEAYAEQLALARRVDALRAPIAAAEGKATRALRALGELAGTAPPGLRPTLAKLRDQVAEVAGVTVTSNPSNAWAFPPRRMDSLRFVHNALDGLYGAVQGADAPPSEDVKQGLAKVEPMTRAALAAWESLEKRELAAANRAAPQGRPEANRDRALPVGCPLGTVRGRWHEDGAQSAPYGAPLLPR